MMDMQLSGELCPRRPHPPFYSFLTIIIIIKIVSVKTMYEEFLRL